ncbi:Phosphoglycerate mutase family [Actinomycetales bacterium JB111]|nr:Phosphoglycerate mutase family [Actinomycetales bacterium JB111]
MRRIVIHTDGGSRGNPGIAGYGSHLADADTGEVLATRSGYLGRTTNNVAEYTAVVEGLRAADLIDPDSVIEVRADSKLVVEQMSGRWKIKHDDMRRLAAEVRGVVDPARVTYTWVPRARNTLADALANKAMDSKADAHTDEWRGSAADSPTTEPGPAAGGASGGGASSSGASVPVEPASLFDDDSFDTGSSDTATSDATPRAQSSEQAMRLGTANKIYLVRHGVTPWTVAGKNSGSDTPGPDLTEEGRQHARNAGRLIKALAPSDGVDLTQVDVLASPMVRTRQTAEEITAILGTGAATIDDRLREVTFGEWNGLTEQEINAGWPGGFAEFRADIDHQPPGGESHRQVGARVAQVLRDFMGDEGRTIILVAHAVVVRTAVALVGGIDPRAWGRVRVRPGSVTMLSVSGLDPEGRFTGQVNYVGAPGEAVDG